jgi:hypothetical protein
VAAFEHALSKDWNFTLTMFSDKTSAVRQWRTVMTHLGLQSHEWTLSDDRVQLRSIEGLQEALARFRDRTPAWPPGNRPRSRRTRKLWRAFADQQ